MELFEILRELVRTDQKTFSNSNGREEGREGKGRERLLATVNHSILSISAALAPYYRLLRLPLPLLLVAKLLREE